MDLEEVQVAAYLRSHPVFLEEWLERNSDPTILGIVQKVKLKLQGENDEKPHEPSTEASVVEHDSTDLEVQEEASLSRNGGEPEDDDDDILDEPPSVVPRTGRKSVTSDLFHQWLASGTSTSTSSSNATIARSILPASTPEEDKSSLSLNDKLMELILDISNELDISVLCHKILVNVCRLAKADRSSLFLARGPRGKRYLEAKLFDVTVDTSLDEAMARANKESISIPFGVGICGQVAETKETIYIKEASKDSRFNKEVDAKTGYSTHSLVSMPVCNFDGDVIGVAQIMNKMDPASGCFEFAEADLKVFQRYLTFCGIGIQNAQLFEVSILEYKKNKLLLSLAKNLFEEQMSLERLVSTIITEAKSLLKCERCTVYLLDLRMYDAKLEEHMLEDANFFVNTGTASAAATCRSPSSITSAAAVVGGAHGPVPIESSEFVFPPEDSSSTCSAASLKNAIIMPGTNLTTFLEETNIRFQRAWELTSESSEVKAYGPTDVCLHQSPRAKIAKYVAATAEVLNLSSVAKWLGDKLEDKDGFVPRTMLCLPIYNGQRDVIGVAQLINKNNGSAFEESDIALFEAFAIFCGIGIHNTKMYEGAIKLMAKQKVALDCLSYHASATMEDTEDLAQAVIPSADTFSLHSYKFNDMTLSDEETYKVTVRMFLDFGLVNQFHIPYKVLCRWVLSVKKNYRPVSYHNWRHALNVCQTMFTVLRTGKMDRFMDDLEVLGLLVACLCHDLDHRGTNNAFQSKVESPLAILYSTSTMEHHHFDQCVMILSSEGNNIFQGLNTEDYRRVMKVVEQAILSTDLALYFRKKDRFLETANCGEIDWQEQEKKELLCGMLMTACDVSAIAKPWEQQHLLAKRVADEFFDQGDLEKLRLNTQPIAMMDRDRKDELPKMQVEFIDVVCRPLYTSLSESFPWIKPLLDGCLSNREKWTDLAEKVEMGLTWIDHDTIEKPIEEITLGTDEAVDIEFTVETLKSANAAAEAKKAAICKKRSFRGHHASSKTNKASGSSFFHRRLSSKSPSRSATTNITTEIQVDHHGPHLNVDSSVDSGISNPDDSSNSNNGYKVTRSRSSTMNRSPSDGRRSNSPHSAASPPATSVDPVGGRKRLSASFSVDENSPRPPPQQQPPGVTVVHSSEDLGGTGLLRRVVNAFK